MQTKDEIREEYRIVTCDGLYRVQRLCDGVWVPLDNRHLLILTFYPDVVFQTDDVKLAKRLLKGLINKRYRAQEDAWQPID